jgi:alkanesulfonate monooxygenase SsuD/methylene tetrahydromethanopterin reductase-like flavin-dependent oxidoreductase (luciferase family)
MRRAARFGDGWLPYMYTPEMLAGSLATIGAMRDRDEPVHAGLFIWGCVHEDGDVARTMAIESLSKTYAQDFSRLVDKYAFAGTPDDVVSRLRQFADAGATTVIVSFASPRDHLDAARRLFAERVLPALV